MPTGVRADRPRPAWRAANWGNDPAAAAHISCVTAHYTTVSAQPINMEYAYAGIFVHCQY